MKWDLPSLKTKSPDELHNLWQNARRLAETSQDARDLTSLIETSGLDYKAGKKQSISIYGKMGKRMREIIYSAAGEKAALAAHNAGLPPLAGIDPLLREEFGIEYGTDNESTSQAGFLVVDLMRQNGYEPLGGSLKLPEGCIARTGQMFGTRRS